MSQAKGATDEGPPTYKGVEKPWRDVEILHRLYWHEELTTEKMAPILGCGLTTVNNWMHRLDVPFRSHKEAFIARDPNNFVNLRNDQYGYVCWSCSEGIVFVHRLMAVAKFGFEAVRDKHVHHGHPDSGPNELPSYECRWANWPGNLELVENATHQRKHLKIDGTDRMAVAEKYEHGDISSRDLGDLYGVSGSTVLKIHGEFFGDNDE